MGCIHHLRCQWLLRLLLNLGCFCHLFYLQLGLELVLKESSLVDPPALVCYQRLQLAGHDIHYFSLCTVKGLHDSVSWHGANQLSSAKGAVPIEDTHRAHVAQEPFKSVPGGERPLSLPEAQSIVLLFPAFEDIVLIYGLLVVPQLHLEHNQQGQNLEIL